MKFDIIVGNPPYGSGQSEIHLKILNSILKYCIDKLVFIMPSKPITQQLKPHWYDMFKNAVCNNVEIIDKNAFPNTKMDNTCIYYCDRNDLPENYSKRFDVDKAIYNMFDKEGHKLFLDKMGIACKKHLKISYMFVNKKYYEKNYKTFLNDASDHRYYLNVSRANGSFGAKWISSELENDILTKDEEIEFCKKNKGVKNIIECSSKTYGENLKNLMVYGLVLRYGLWLLQKSQNINNPEFRYVPDIDYTNITTDEELLRECGFNEEETKTVLYYLSTFDFSKSRNDTIRDYEV